MSACATCGKGWCGHQLAAARMRKRAENGAENPVALPVPDCRNCRVLEAEVKALKKELAERAKVPAKPLPAREKSDGDGQYTPHGPNCMCLNCRYVYRP